MRGEKKIVEFRLNSDEYLTKRIIKKKGKLIIFFFSSFQRYCLRSTEFKEKLLFILLLCCLNIYNSKLAFTRKRRITHTLIIDRKVDGFYP